MQKPYWKLKDILNIPGVDGVAIVDQARRQTELTVGPIAGLTMGPTLVDDLHSQAPEHP